MARANSGMAPFFRDASDIFAVVEGAIDGVDAEGVNIVSFTVGMVIVCGFPRSLPVFLSENCGGNGPFSTSCRGAAFSSGESEKEDACTGCC